MKKYLFLSSLIVLFFTISMIPSDFFKDQLAFPRVRTAQNHKGEIVKKLLSSNGINEANFDLFIRAFKAEQKMEIWAKNHSDNTFKLLTTYPFCASTGTLGPKRKSGDKQIPEGFYEVNFFNPTSQYHLSFRINYPNDSDLVFADKLNPGDNIFIHGDCVTIGCIPIGNENMEELYLMAAKAKSAGYKINVHIFPTKMDVDGMNKLKSEGNENANFWAMLKPGYDAFEATKSMPTIEVSKDGKYSLK